MSLNITRAVITAAAPGQRALPVQTLTDRDGAQKSVLQIIVEEALAAGTEEVCVVVFPGDEDAYRAAAGRHADHLRFIPQTAPRGYGHALHCAQAFLGGDPFLHLVGDHVYLSQRTAGCAAQIAAAARAHGCALSGVQATRESLLPYFGAIGGHRVSGTHDLFVVEAVREKPTPTEAELSLAVPGLRAGHYLCFFGIHVLTATVLELLERRVAEAAPDENITLSPVLAELSQRERYLAIEAAGRRYPVDGPYGLLTAQLALALSGVDREEVLLRLSDLLTHREVAPASSSADTAKGF